MPKIKTTDQNLVTDAGKPFVMSVPYDAYPRADAEWFLQGSSLPVQNVDTTTDKTEYRLKCPTKEEKGRYKVIIKNKHGEGEAFINLDVIGKVLLLENIIKDHEILKMYDLKRDVVFSDVPGPVKALKVTDTTDGEVSLAWEEPESDGGSKIVAYVVERRDMKRKTWTLATDRADTPEYCVSGLQKDSWYLFRVCARNRVGSGPSVSTDDAVQAKNKFGEKGPPQDCQ